MGVEGGGIVLYILGVGVAVFKNRLCRVVSSFFFFFPVYFHVHDWRMSEAI